jgi:hypothetical protein
MVYQPVHAGRATRSSYTVHLSKGWFPAPGERVFLADPQGGVIHRMYVGYAQWKFTLCRETGYSYSVSSTLPKDGFKLTAFIPVGFFLPFSLRPKKKPAIDIDAGFPCLLSSPAHRHGFCDRIMKLKALRVYMHCNIIHWQRKSPLGYSQRAEIQP